MYSVIEDFGRGLTVEDDARAVVQPPLHFADLALRNGVKIDALGEVFADEAVDIFDGTALPGAMGVAKVDGDFGGDREGGVLVHFATVVVGEGLAQMGGQVSEGPGQGPGDALGVFGRAQRDDDHVAGDALGDHQDGGSVARTHDQVGLPVTGHLSVLHLGGSLTDVTDRKLDLTYRKLDSSGDRAGRGNS